MGKYKVVLNLHCLIRAIYLLIWYYFSWVLIRFSPKKKVFGNSPNFKKRLSYLNSFANNYNYKLLKREGPQMFFKPLELIKI